MSQIHTQGTGGYAVLTTAIHTALFTWCPLLVSTLYLLSDPKGRHSLLLKDSGMKSYKSSCYNKQIQCNPEQAAAVLREGVSGGRISYERRIGEIKKKRRLRWANTLGELTGARAAPSHPTWAMANQLSGLENWLDNAEIDKVELTS